MTNYINGVRAVRRRGHLRRAGAATEGRTMSADQPCMACGSTEAACMISPSSCCDMCALAAGFTHDDPSDQAMCPEASDHGEMDACSSCSYASRRMEAGR